MEALKVAYDSSESESDGDHASSTIEPEGKRAKRQSSFTKDVPSFALRKNSYGPSTQGNFKEIVGADDPSVGLYFQSDVEKYMTTGMEVRQNRNHIVTHKSGVTQSQPREQRLTPNTTAKHCAVPRNEDKSNIRRYIPKREREEIITANTSPELLHHRYNKECNTECSSDLDENQQVSARSNFTATNRAPKKVLVELKGHTKGVNCVRWCPQRDDLLLSASMDHSVHLWDIRRGQCIRKLYQHGAAAVKDAKWSSCGTKVLSCGYDKMARITDVQTGQELQHFLHQDYATCAQYHPTDPNIFLVGTFKSSILCWDSRTDKVVSIYSAFFGQVQDLAFLPGGEAFVSAAEVVRRNSTDKGIMVWDFKSTAILSNQIYQEAFTCTCLRVHPCEAHFIAQSSGDYVAIFSTKRPYKLNKLKRYEGHKVSGYHIGCDISPDGSIVASGSSDGNLYFYNQHTSRIIKTISAHSMACMDVAYHPSFPSTVASCGWDGSVVVWE